MIEVKINRLDTINKIILNSISPRICKVEVSPKIVCLKFKRVDLEHIIFDGENVIFDGEQVVQ